MFGFDSITFAAGDVVVDETRGEINPATQAGEMAIAQQATGTLNNFDGKGKKDGHGDAALI